MITDETEWRRTTPDGLIRSNEVHVWRVCLDVPACQYKSLLQILSADELARAGRFRFQRDQKRFIVARGMLRMLLGHYLRTNPNEICFECTSFGKPVLVRNSGYDAFNFNLSHSDAIALYAITRVRAIGIDIERVRDDIAIEQIAQQFFSAREISSLEQTQENRRSEIFFQYWARKEAFLKAIGKGLSFPMEQCDVSSISRNVLSPIIMPGNNLESSCWYGQDLPAGNGYAAAIAVEGSNWNLSCWDYLHEA